MPYIGVSPQFGVRRKHTYTATAGQTSFSGAGAEGATLSYKDSNFVDVYQNGVKLGDADYTATSGTAIVLGTGATVSDLVVIVAYDVFSAADTVSKADGGTFDGNVTMAGTLGVTGVSTLTGNLLVGGTTTNHQTGSSQEQLSYIAGDYFAVSRSSNDVAFFNRQSTDGSIINVRKDGTTVGSIGSRAGVALNIVLDPRTSGCGLTGVGQVIRPTDESGTNEDNTIDLGSSSHRFKDLYLSGAVYLGGTGSSNALSDYEEGTYEPAFTGSSGGTFTANTSYKTLSYTKVGRKVYIQGRIRLASSSSPSGALYMSLPFNVATLTEESDYSAGTVAVRQVNLSGTSIHVSIGDHTTKVGFIETVDNGTWANTQTSSVDSSAMFLFSFSYLTS